MRMHRHALTWICMACAQVWDLRLKWIAGLLHGLGQKQWSVTAMVGVMVENCLSFNDLQKFRQALSLEYSKDHDRYMQPVWFVAPQDKHLVRPRFLRVPEPIPAVHLIKEEFRKYQGELKIEVSEDGKVASHSFQQKVVEMHEHHKANLMLAEGCGASEGNRHAIVYAFDAFPVKGISVEHAVIFSASLLNESQSEALCKIIFAALTKENNEGINRMHSNRKLDVEFNRMLARGWVFGSDGTTKIWVKIIIACDKKAVENFVGCAPGCAWCECSKDQRLATAWAVDKCPRTWEEAAALLSKTCTRPFPTAFDTFSAAHLALPWEKVPRKCRYCNAVPHRNETEYKAELKCYADRRADTSKEGAAAFLRERSTHAGSVHLLHRRIRLPSALAYLIYHCFCLHRQTWRSVQARGPQFDG